MLDFDRARGPRRGYRLRALLLAGMVLPLLHVGSCARDPEVRKQRYLASGNAYSEQGKYREAIIEYLNAVRIDPKFAEARKRLGDAYISVGEPTAAARAYVRAADLLPADLTVQLKTANLLLLAGDHDDARARAEAALKLDADNVQAHIILGLALVGLKDTDGGLKQVEEALRLDPSSSQAHSFLGMLQVAQGRREQAEASLRKAVELGPKSVPAMLALANFLWTTGRIDEAERWMNSALKLDPHNLLANRSLAALYLSTGRQAQAERYFRAISEASSGPEGQLPLADYYLTVGRLADAIHLLEPLASDRSVATAVELRLGEAYLANGDKADAGKMAGQLLAREPGNAGALLLQSRLMASDGKMDEAVERARAAAVAAPQSAQVQFILGRLLAARGDADGARQAFTRVLALNPRAAAARLEMSKLHLAQGRPDLATDFAEEAVNAEPDSLQAKLALARSLLAERRIEDAARQLAPVLAARPDDAEVQVLAGLVAGGRQDRAGARAAFERAERLAPGSLEALSGLVGLDLAARDFKAAEARVNARIAAGSPSSGLLVLAGRTFLASGDAAGAERFWRQAIDVDPAALDAYARLGRLYVSQRRLDDARQEFEALATRQVKPVAALTMAGQILLQEGRTDAAREHFERVLALDPNAAVAANDLAWIYAETGVKLDEALQLAQTAVASLPKSAEARDTLGWVYYKRQAPELAVGALKECVAQETGNPVYRYHLGLAYVLAGDVARARAALERALALNPHFAGAADARRTLADLAG